MLGFFVVERLFVRWPKETYVEGTDCGREFPSLNSFAVKAPLLTLSLDKQFGFLSDCLLLEMCKRKSSIQLDDRNAETSELQTA
jgi:hypothetical protein